MEIHPIRNTRAIDPTTTSILIVDDEPSVLKVLDYWLSMEGYHCTHASNGLQACELLRTNDFALLISDISMPGMSGIDLLALAKQQDPDLAVIMLTGVEDREVAKQTMQLGAFGYMIKPIKPNEIIIGVTHALERRRLSLLSQHYERELEERVRERTAELQQRTFEIRQREEEMTIRLVMASEYRDEETGLHIRRIGLFADMLAHALGWMGDAMANLRLAAPMHDIGKIGIADHILLKAGKLTDDEFEIMKHHTEIGASILADSDIPLLKMARDIAAQHHERWDGSGYPLGLAGDAITESARIVAVADVYDALMSNRVYRPAFSEEKTLAIMQEGRGSHFDPTIFDCLLENLPHLREIRENVNTRYTKAY